MFRGNDRDPGGKVLYTDRGFRLVLSLAPRSAGAVGFDSDLVLQDVRIGIKLWVGGIHHANSTYLNIRS